MPLTFEISAVQIIHYNKHRLYADTCRDMSVQTGAVPTLVRLCEPAHLEAVRTSCGTVPELKHLVSQITEALQLLNGA